MRTASSALKIKRLFLGDCFKFEMVDDEDLKLLIGL